MASKSQLAIEWPVFRPRGWGMPTKARAIPRPWFGFDTERDTQRSDIRAEYVCGWAVGETEMRIERLTDFPPGAYWIWNIAYDIEGMLRDLRIEEAWAAKVDGASFPLLDGNAVYYHGKRFTWKRPDGVRNFIEASNFFGRQPLSAIGAKKRLDASQMSLDRYLTEPEYRLAVDEYCKEDARIVYNAITKLALGLRNLGVEIGATPGSTARRFMSRLGAFPPVIWQTHKAFLRSYCGGRFELTKRGVGHDLYQYDQVSAYPYALSKCPWLTETAFSRQTRRFSDGALYGTYNVSFKLDDYLGIAPRWRGGVRVYSKQENDTWLTRPEVDWLLKQGADVHIWRGVEIFDENATQLWADVILELFDLKQRGKNEVDGGWGAKIILNSEYGILIQLVRRTGKWVSVTEAKDPIDFAGTLALEAPPKEFEGGKYLAPVYAGNLTGIVRVGILDAAQEVTPEHYWGSHTDSVLTTRRLRRNIGTQLGAWKLEQEAPRADLCKTGMYALGSKVKLRGITRDASPELLWGDSFQRKSRIGIKRATNWNDVSVILPKTVANNINTELKRLWKGDVTRSLIALEKHVDSEALCLVS